MTLNALRTLALFDGIDDSALEALTASLRRLDHVDPVVLLSEGDRSEEFLILVSGEAIVTLGEPGSSRHLATVGAGSVLGEVGLLTERVRMATVATTGPSTVLGGGLDAFEELLAHPLLRERLLTMARNRVAADIEPVEVHRDRDWPVLLRPILPTDRDAMVEAVRSASPDTLNRRFLSGGPPSSAMIDYLVRVDYVDHFAWVALDPAHLNPAQPDPAIGVGRYVRLRANRDQAEVAFTVREDAQGRGLGTLLLGAAAAVAEGAGITQFVASVRSDNVAMLHVLTRAGASFDREEPGVTSAMMLVERAASLVSQQHRERLRHATADLVTLTG